MRVRSKLLSLMHLDNTYCLLTVRHVKILQSYFNLLDIHGDKSLNDVQAYCFMRLLTDLTKDEIYQTFDMLDVDGSGEMEFSEFFILVCVLIAVQDHVEKQFIYRHCRTIFGLIDIDGSNSITPDEFRALTYLFDFKKRAMHEIFYEFDISGDQELDYREFRLFAMACIDKQQELEKKMLEKAEEMREKALEKEKKKQELNERYEKVGIIAYCIIL
ncbi:EF-hand calcium-binding domain-containing protein 9-like [Branchiostoma lanceolatum]|uniref:EF-hand calcium-binding domain-containing protein 9-like n=1 Tax=Branchiostoma lanceolatum TaxID=7740 RepID=UPI0034562812